jgi:septal ring factor EnvC (AmiA/AmiB activator)
MFTATLLLSMMLPQAVASQRVVAAPAMQVRPVPDEAVRKQARLSANLTPAVRAKIAACAQSLTQRLRAMPTASVAQMQGAAQTATMEVFPGLRGADLDTVVFLVMSETAQQQQADLQAQMSQMQQQMAQKQAQRDSTQGMNAMSEMQQMKLQSMMDRRSKLLEAMSNIMKATSDTADSITQNLK